MKIRTKLLITFLTITVVPNFLIYISILGLSSYQNRVFRETYDVGQVDLSAGASIRVFSHLTESIQKEIEEKIRAATEGIYEGMDLHDFRIVRGATVKVIFEVGVPFACKAKDGEILEKLERSVKILGFEPVITVERE